MCTLEKNQSKNATIQVILSVPIVSSTYGAIILSIRSSTISDVLSISFLLAFTFDYISLTFQHTSSFERQSQMPSQAITMKLSSGLRSNLVTSGKGDTACSYGDLFYWSLNLKSPKARLRASAPSTLLSWTIWFAFLILVDSSLLSGLWSSLSGTTSPPPPFLKSTDLLSPIFAQ